ncbi:MAG: NRPS [Sclerophora amabilis]|nr:MAG: NRPS [Sclerophora amabilis]
MASVAAIPPFFESKLADVNSATDFQEQHVPESDILDSPISTSFYSDFVEEFDCTPLQQELLQCDERNSRVSIQWRLSPTEFTGIDRLLYTWQALASHNSILRSIIIVEGSPPHARFRQRVLNRASPVQFGFQEEDPVYLGEGHIAILAVYLLKGHLTVRLQIDSVFADQTSLALIQRDFALFYNGRACKFHAPFREYVDNVCKRDPQPAIDFWEQSLSGVTVAPVYSFPIHREPLRSLTAAKVDQDLLHTTRLFSELHKLSMRGVCYAAWALALACHMEASNHTITFAAVGRDTTDTNLQSMVGPVDQTYPLKLSISRETRVLQWVRDVETADRQFSSRAYIGYKQINAISRVPPQVKVAFIDGLKDNGEEGGHATFPMTLNIYLSTSFELALHHNASTPNSKAHVLLEHFQAALLYIVGNPFSTIGSVDLVSQNERQSLLAYGQPAMKPAPGLIHRLFERQVELTPDAEAVQFEANKPLTYLQLNQLSNAVARQLPCGRGSFVPLCLRRSTNMIVALLAILKTGAAYVTLDPDSPPERNNYIAGDVSAPMVIVDEYSEGTFEQECVIGRLIDNTAKFHDSNLEVDQEPSDIAYIIYTSGSTGKPKGVLLEHSAAHNGLLAFPTLPNLRQLLFHNPIFSAAQRSIFSTLKQGGCLCLAGKENLTVYIADTINIMKINVIDVTPSTASLITPGTVPSLRRMTVAGELINPALLPIWLRELQLLNAYGLSEVTQINWRHTMEDAQNPQNIGRPNDTTSSYVLVPGTTRLSPLLVPGELCLGGHQLAREYLNRPEKTADAFIQNPFGHGRLYRTGDMVVAHEDGSIEMIGRIDFQTKVNGQRVEPGEGNAILQTHPSVYASCTVSALVGPKNALVAVIVPMEGISWSTLVPQLQAMLRRHLPSYMVPTFWLSRVDLPLNVNGKVDVPVLCKIVESLGREGLLLRPEMVRDSVQTLTEREKILRCAWGSVISMDDTEIRLDDSFLVLGGTSLEAILVVSLARKHCLEVRLQDMLQAKSLSEIARRSKWLDSRITTSPPAPFSLLPDTVRLDRDSLEDAYPVTPFQEALLADSSLGNSTYIYTRVFKFDRSQLNLIKRAFQRTLLSNEMVRSTFVEHGNSFLQVIRKRAHIPWEQPQSSLQDYLKRQESEPMPLGHPFLRIAIVEQNFLVLSAHHALFDFWSNQFLYDDIASIIAGITPLERPPFSHYARYIQEKDRTKTQEFWQSYLAGASLTRLGFEPGRENSVTAEIDFSLKSFSIEREVTVGTLLYTSWAIVLSALTTSNDLVFGITLSGRDAPIPDILSMSGPTSAFVPLRVELGSESTLLSLAQAVQTGLWNMNEHAHYGLRNILKASGLPGALFDTTVNFLIKNSDQEPNAVFQHITPERPNHTEYVKLELEDGKFDHLTLLSTLDQRKAQIVLDSVVSTLRGIVHSPSSLARAFQTDIRKRLQPPEPKSDILPSTPTLAHTFLERWAEETPEKIAIEDNQGGSCSYVSLNGQANSFSALLCQKGVKPEIIVPMLLSKSLNMLVAIFGTMKAGAAFTPLDPTHPRQRNLFILDDVAARVAVTDRANVGFFEGLDLDVVIIDDVDLSGHSDENVSIPTLTPDNIVYSIYTSGSTGLPKGVVIPHSALSAATDGMIEAFGATSSWRMLWVLNYVFDGSYHSIFSALGAGGTLCLTDQDHILPDLAGLINNFNVGQISVTPTIARLISPEQVPGLELLSLGGEPLDQNLIDVWTPHVSVFNAYGPTESTILITAAKVKSSSSPRNIGYPLRSAHLSILDGDTAESVPLGDVGELCVSGPQVARGYLNRPEATSAAFHTDVTGRRRYHTGDIARWLSDGQIELLGRKDDQVKINGFRIELGEIESAIVKSVHVRRSVVGVATIQGKRQLVAYCIPSSNRPTDVVNDGSLLLRPDPKHEFSTAAAKLTTLTHYMIPTVWLPVVAFPLLPSGKTDRKSLTLLAESIDGEMYAQYLGLRSPNQSEEIFTPPETEQEMVLQSAWASLFEKPAETFSSTAKFFAFGGDSISAINLVSACRRLGYDLTVPDVVTYPTLREQAKRLSRAKTTNVQKSTKFVVGHCTYERLKEVNVCEDMIEDVYPCLPGQVEFLVQGKKEHQFWQLMTIRRLPEDFDVERWVTLTTCLTERNQILRAMFLQTDENDPLHWVQVILKNPTLDLTFKTYGTAEERQALVDDNWNRFFELGKPFVRYEILTSRKDGSRDLCIKLDHAMYDGTLLRIMDDQFTALAEGKQPPKSTEFKRMIEYCSNTDRAKTLAFWTDLMRESSSDYLHHILDPRIEGMIFAPFDSGIDAFAQRCGVTVPVVFQSAYTLLLAQLSHHKDVTYDNLITGRNVSLDEPQLINGNCANFLPFRAKFDPSSTTLTDLLKETQSLFWQTTENGMIGLGDIYAALGQDRRKAATRALFCFQPFEPPPAEQSHMRWVVMSLSKVSMFFNYAVILEIFKASKGYRVKLQYDTRAFSAEEAKRVMDDYVLLLERIIAAETEHTLETLGLSN